MIIKTYVNDREVSMFIGADDIKNVSDVTGKAIKKYGNGRDRIVVKNAETGEVYMDYCNPF